MKPPKSQVLIPKKNTHKPNLRLRLKFERERERDYFRSVQLCQIWVESMFFKILTTISLKTVFKIHVFIF